jgi:hypothetical protein
MKARSGASKQIASYAIRHIRATRWRWWPIGHIVRTLTAAGLTPVAVSPMIPTSQPHPARWVQVVARRE